MDFNYKIHHLPVDSPSFPFLAGRFASLRLSALTISADAFSSNFKIESDFSSPDWIARLQRPDVHIFVCVAYDSSVAPAEQTIERGAWIGKVTLLGPLSAAAFALPDDAGCAPLGAEGTETYWQMTALYSDPMYRGKGVARLLINGAMQFAANADEAKKARVRIFIRPSNLLVKSLYDKLSFVEKGRCTLAEAFRQNGDESLLPPDGGLSNPEKYAGRKGLVMEWFEG